MGAEASTFAQSSAPTFDAPSPPNRTYRQNELPKTTQQTYGGTLTTATGLLLRQMNYTDVGAGISPFSDVKGPVYVHPDYIEKQKELSWEMRGLLIDWLISLQHDWRFSSEALCLAVNLIDRFLSLANVSREKLSIVGITALLIASQDKDTHPITIHQCLTIANNQFSERDIHNLAICLCHDLSSNQPYLSPLTLLWRLLLTHGEAPKVRKYARYFVEISLLDHQFLPYSPWQVAAAALYLGRKTQHYRERVDWVGALQRPLHEFDQKTDFHSPCLNH
ncbi:G2/mitotic-specific cyclin [Rhizophlyctis rosea]|nr:G2/mitotic-specific cyclin [Rhizophlyctis rosea]